MPLTSSVLHLFYASDFFSQFLVILLIKSGVLVILLSLYAILKLHYKKHELSIVFNNIKEKKDITKNYFSHILLYAIEKNNSEDILFHIISVYIQKELKIKLFLIIATVTAPLIGLLGTIWGVMNVFLSIQNSFDIKTIAPGIAEALITTLAGLFVAIPAAIISYVISFLLKSYINNVELCYLYYQESYLNEKKK